MERWYVVDSFYNLARNTDANADAINESLGSVDVELSSH